MFKNHLFLSRDRTEIELIRNEEHEFLTYSAWVLPKMSEKTHYGRRVHSYLNFQIHFDEYRGSRRPPSKTFHLQCLESCAVIYIPMWKISIVFRQLMYLFRRLSGGSTVILCSVVRRNEPDMVIASGSYGGFLDRTQSCDHMADRVL